MENILYRLHSSLLKQTSIVFTDMFTMPSEGCDPHLIEGQTDDKPIKLKSPFTPVKLDHLLTWFYL